MEEPVPGAKVRRGGGRLVTLTAQAATKPPSRVVAVTVVEPAALAVTRPEALTEAVAALDGQHVGDRINIFLAHLCFRGIYFPMLTKLSWLRVIVENRRTILRLFKDGMSRWIRPSAVPSDETPSLEQV